MFLYHKLVQLAFRRPAAGGESADHSADGAAGGTDSHGCKNLVHRSVQPFVQQKGDRQKHQEIDESQGQSPEKTPLSDAFSHDESADQTRDDVDRVDSDADLSLF